MNNDYFVHFFLFTRRDWLCSSIRLRFYYLTCLKFSVELFLFVIFSTFSFVLVQLFFICRLSLWSLRNHYLTLSLFSVMTNSNSRLADNEEQFRLFDWFVHSDRQSASNKQCLSTNQFVLFWKEILINLSKILRFCRKLWSWINFNWIIEDIFIMLWLSFLLFNYSNLKSIISSWKICQWLLTWCRTFFSRTMIKSKWSSSLLCEMIFWESKSNKESHKICVALFD